MNDSAELPSRLVSILKKHGHHIVFSLSIISLASLIIWWSIFIHNSIQQQELSQYEKLELDLKYLALKLGSDKDHRPVVGDLIEDRQYEVVPFGSSEERLVRRLEPHWPEFCIKPQAEILQKIEKKYDSLNFMLIGEASLLILTIFICSILLYRFIQLDRRTAKEVREFWERSAHEIKTPITGLKLFLQNLKRRSYSLEEIIPYVDMALRQVGKQEQMAENILSGYHLKSKRDYLKLTDVNLNVFLSEYIRKSALFLTDAKVNLDIKQNSEVRIRGDIRGLKVILDNILDNAIKYCSPGLILTVGIKKEKKHGVVVLRDNGPGIPPKFRENIFRAYKHLDDELPTKRQGTGIGLFISRQLAKKMGGDLKIKSEGTDQGTQFHLFVKLAK
jgi:signal transduction histidine kinase